MAYSFGDKSQALLDTCTFSMRMIVNKAMSYQVMDFSIITGHRDKATQNEKFEEGLSKVQWPNGKHNTFPSNAVDLAPFPIDWEDKERFVLIAGVMFVASKELNIPIRWGGDWNMDGYQRDEPFRDRGHFEIL